MSQLLFEMPLPSKETHLLKKKHSLKKKKNDELKKTHRTHPQFKDIIENSDKHIKFLSQSTLDKLGRNLDIIREQMETAFKKRKYSTFELLYEWENQHIIARLIKFDKKK